MAHQAPKPNDKSKKDPKPTAKAPAKKSGKPLSKRPSLLTTKPKDTGRKQEPKLSTVQRVVGYLRAVRAELGKVIWPKRPEIIQSTLIVIATLVVFGLYIFVLDTIFEQLITLVSGGFVR